MEPIPGHLNRYIEYFETMTIDSVNDLDQLAVEDLHFKDPFHDVTSREKVKVIFTHGLTLLKSPKFRIKNKAYSNGTLWVLWDFSFRLEIWRWSRGWSIEGVSLVKSESEKVVEHIDYWDANSELFAKLPLLGSFARWLIWLFRAH
jgi:steroid delta-isomerase